MASGRHGRPHWRAAILLGVFATVASVTAPDAPRAEGLFDFFFGFQERPPPPAPSVHPPPSPGVGRIAPARLDQESVSESGGGGTGHSVAFCVRLCDGQHFPLENMARATPAETCRAICPHSKTKVFFGTDIGNAVAQDGQRYAALGTAFVYRKQLVSNCTCNGRDAFGLSSLDVKSDPTLRPGDIVSSKDGLMAYTGKSSQGSAFAPVNPAALPPNMRPGSAPPPPPSDTESTVEDEPGTIVQPDKR
jgi:Protein of unknown function (DUF2865)